MLVIDYVWTMKRVNELPLYIHTNCLIYGTFQTYLQ
jgi:hypothetical protein